MENSTMPRELRDEIYAYLLDFERMREFAQACSITLIGSFRGTMHYRELGGPRMSYRFHTGISAGNKTIGAEASEYLYLKNCFVLVRWAFEGYKLLRAMADVPDMTKVDTETFDHYPFVLDV